MLRSLPLLALGLIGCSTALSPEDCYAISSRNVCDFAPVMRTSAGETGRCLWVPGHSLHADLEPGGGLTCNSSNQGVCAAVLAAPGHSASELDYCAEADSPVMYWYPDGERAMSFEMEPGWEVVGAQHGQCGDGSELDETICACSCQITGSLESTPSPAH